MPKQKILISIADENAAYQPVLEVELDAAKVKSLLKTLRASRVPEPGEAEQPEQAEQSSQPE